MTLTELERRALDLAKTGDFGDEAARVNAAIVELAPQQQSAWTRLGRCHLEQRRFDDAVAALRSALALNPSNATATNLLAEVRRRRALTPTASERATTGFTAREFAVLETSSADEACRALAPRIEALLSSLNASTIAERIVSARRRNGDAGSKLFHANSCHAGGAGHIYAFHHGGRWEPQFNIGWFSSPPHPANCLRAGIGFNCSTGGRDADRDAGPDRVVRYFERFQRALDRSWKRELVQWMAANGGFLQYGSNAPATGMLPERAVEWLVQCRQPTVVEWIFVGSWLLLDRPDDARILADRARLARFVDDTFRTLFPLWLSTYSDEPAT